MLVAILPLFAAVVAQPADPLVSTMADGSRHCLSLATQSAFNDTGFLAGGWSRELAPRWYKPTQAEQAYGMTGSETVLSVVGPSLFPMMRMCTVETPLPRGASVSTIASALAQELEVEPLDLTQTPITPAEDEYFYRPQGGGTMAVAINRRDGKRTVRAMFVMN